MVGTFEAKVLEIKDETPSVRTIVLDKSMDFKPGQFINVIIPVNGKDETRPYSISSSPTEEHIAITIKKYPESFFPKALFSLKENDVVKIKGPFGRFILEDRKDLVFIAGGCGIAPLRSMVKYSIDKKLNNKLTLIYSDKTLKDLIFHSELLELQKQNKNLKLVFTITRPDSTPWNGLTGRINKAMIRNNVNDINASLFYISGPSEMVDNVVDILRNIGVEDSRIRIEKFTRRSQLGAKI